jgi:hypothetical protein
MEATGAIYRTIRKVLDKYADTQINLGSSRARELLAKDINDALALRENIALANDERQREWDANFGKVPTLAVKLLAGDK